MKNLNITADEFVVVCFQHEFTEGDRYYSAFGTPTHGTFTQVKLQLFYEDGDIEECLQYNSVLGYTYA